MATTLTVTVQPTPNVNALKFVVNRRMTEGRSQTFTDAATAASPLARDLLGIEGVRQVFLLNDFITITRTDGTDWNAVVPQAEALIRQHLGGTGVGCGRERPRVRRAAFERLVAQALEGLPRTFAERLRNVAVLVEARPSPRRRRRTGRTTS